MGVGASVVVGASAGVSASAGVGVIAGDGSGLLRAAGLVGGFVGGARWPLVEGRRENRTTWVARGRYTH